MTFVTLEGLDGSGKSTVLDAITDEYSNTVVTSEPSDREYGKLVRRNLSVPDSDPLLDFYLFMADRVDHVKKLIEPADQQGNLVVSDRYGDSTRAYQPVALSSEAGPFGSMWEAKVFIEETMDPWDYEPDLTLYIDISVDTAIERADGDEKYEHRAFLEKVKDNYDALADHTDRIVRIDGEQSQEEVAAAAMNELR